MTGQRVASPGQLVHLDELLPGDRIVVALGDGHPATGPYLVRQIVPNHDGSFDLTLATVDRVTTRRVSAGLAARGALRLDNTP